MNLELFLTSLTYSEKKKLYRLLEKDLENTGDTVKEFIERMEQTGEISLRTLSILRQPQIFDLLLSDITDENALCLGFGNVSYAEFLSVISK